MIFGFPRVCFPSYRCGIAYSRRIMTSPLWNVNAREFTPSTALSSPALSPACKLRVEAPIFVPLSSLKSEVHQVIQSAGVSGIRVRDIPKAFLKKFGVALDLSSSPFSDLSLLVSSLSDVSLTEDKGDVRNLADAMQVAGFNVAPESFPEDDNAVVSPSGSEEETMLGLDSEKTAKISIFDNFVEDLKKFKNSILDVTYNFALKNGTHPGLALSLFAAEWERYHSVRGIPADLRALRERFGVVKLMPFLQAIPELDVVGTHPEVRVRIKDGFVGRQIQSSPRRKGTVTTPSSWYSSPDISTHEGSTAGPRNISLTSELFGESTLTTTTPETQTRTVLEQMLASTQSQILSILSQVPSDPLSAAGAIEKMNELQVLVNALKAALAVLPETKIPKRPISIESALFGPTPPAPKATTLNLESMLADSFVAGSSAPPSPITAASSAAPQVGPLLADLSRILFAQVIQQQQPTALDAAAETTAALERTLAELVSAASSPPASPGSSLVMESVVAGKLIIPPYSLPSSPIMPERAPTPSVTNEDAATMHQLLKGLMSALPPPGLAPVAPIHLTQVSRRVYGKEFLMSVRRQMEGQLEAPPAEIAGLTCRQVLRVPHKQPRVTE